MYIQFSMETPVAWNHLTGSGGRMMEDGQRFVTCFGINVLLHMCDLRRGSSNVKFCVTYFIDGPEADI